MKGKLVKTKRLCAYCGERLSVMHGMVGCTNVTCPNKGKTIIVQDFTASIYKKTLKADKPLDVNPRSHNYM